MSKKKDKYYPTGIEGWWTQNPHSAYIHLTPRDAQEKLHLVKQTLEELASLGESYAHFQSAQITHKNIKKAIKLLTNLS